MAVDNDLSSHAQHENDPESLELKASKAHIETPILECPPHTTERKLVTKIDLHVIPFLSVMYVLAFLDRVNISNANVFGLSEELHLDGTLYNNALVIFFVPYVIFEIPSNILLKRLKPHVWLSANMTLFGLVTLVQGFVQNYGGLMATRFFLGLFEAGMVPGAFYLLGMWYRRHEAQKRFSFFFSSTSLAGAFGGLLAAAIGKMEGMRGYKGWRWIFIIEGAITVVCGLVFYFFLPDFPEDTKWLTDDERAYASARLQIEQGRSSVERKVTFKDVIQTLKDYKVLLGGLMYFSLVVPVYGYSYFAPAIIQTYGYSPIQTQLHSVPPWAACFGFSMVVAYLSDKTQHRVGFAVGAVFVCITGFAILLGADVDNIDLKYGALFLAVSGAFTATPILACWFGMNLGGHHRRATGSAFQVSFGNIGSIIGVFTFRKTDAPRYVSGNSMCIGFAALGALSCSLYALACMLENKKRDRGSQGANLTEDEKAELGDLSPDYRYLF
ncbi:hypothetical protein FDECE_789 [Fusarium decemcellulare]|nr:hypothetical protein FDECE_789 [Fusarium decemcellulare]